MRELSKYFDASVAPNDPMGVIEDLKKLIEKSQDDSNVRSAKSDADLKTWLANMAQGPIHANVTRTLEALDAHAPLDHREGWGLWPQSMVMSSSTLMQSTRPLATAAVRAAPDSFGKPNPLRKCRVATMSRRLL